MTASPLGRYGELVAALISVVVVFAAILAHTFTARLGVTDTSWIDNAALLAIGVVLGQRATTNGAAKIALAAHQRLDMIHAPSSADGVPISPTVPPPAGTVIP